MRIKYVLIFGWPLGLIACLIVAAELYTSIYISPLKARSEALYTAHMPRIVEDIEAVDQAPPFPDTAHAKNAEPFLSQHISWDGSGGVKSAATHALTERFRNSYGKWRSDENVFARLLKDEALWKSFDSSWLENLHEFDHFDLATNPAQAAALGKLRDQSGVERVATLASLPVPDYGELAAMARLHAFKSARDGHAAQGLRTLRKVAQLSHTSSTLIGSMIAVSLLKDEEILKKEFGKQLGVASWDLVPSEQIERYRRVSWAWGAVAKSDREMPAGLLQHLKPQAGLCAGVMEGASGPLLLREFLEPRAILESNFQSLIAETQIRQEKFFEICHMTAYRALLEPPPPAPWLLRGDQRLRWWIASLDQDAKDGVELNIARIPYARRLFALQLETIAMPNFLGLYEQKKD